MEVDLPNFEGMEMILRWVHSEKEEESEKSQLEMKKG